MIGLASFDPLHVYLPNPQFWPVMFVLQKPIWRGFVILELRREGRERGGLYCGESSSFII